MSTITKLLKKENFGLLFLRVFLGGMMMAHGIPKFLGGKDTLMVIGQAMGNIGITVFPLFWGFMAALVETLGGFLVIIGYQFRIAALFLTFTMVMATLFVYKPGSAFLDVAWSIELAIVFFSLMFIGPGKYSVDKD